MSYQSEYLDPGATGDPQYQGSRRKNQIPLTQNVMIQNYALNEWMVMDKEVYGGLHRVKYTSLLYRDDIYDGIFSKRRAEGMLCHVKFEDNGTLSNKYYKLLTLPGTDPSHWELFGEGSDIVLTDPSTVENLTARNAIVDPVGGQFVNTNDGRTPAEITANVEPYPASWVYSEAVTDWLRVYPYGKDPNIHARNNDTQILSNDNTAITGEAIKQHMANTNVHKTYNDANSSGAVNEAWTSRQVKIELDKKVGFPTNPTGDRILHDDGTWKTVTVVTTDPEDPEVPPEIEYAIYKDSSFEEVTGLIAADGGAGQLVIGALYAIEYQNIHRVSGMPTAAPAVPVIWTHPVTEHLVLKAVANNKFATECFSLEYPTDIINYDINNILCEDGTTPRKGFITYRRDTILNNSTEGYCFRSTVFPRFPLVMADYEPGVTYNYGCIVKDATEGGCFFYRHIRKTAGNPVTDQMYWAKVHNLIDNPLWPWIGSSPEFTRPYYVYAYMNYGNPGDWPVRLASVDTTQPKYFLTFTAHRADSTQYNADPSLSTFGYHNWKGKNCHIKNTQGVAANNVIIANGVTAVSTRLPGAPSATNDGANFTNITIGDKGVGNTCWATQHAGLTMGGNCSYNYFYGQNHGANVFGSGNGHNYCGNYFTRNNLLGSDIYGNVFASTFADNTVLGFLQNCCFAGFTQGNFFGHFAGGQSWGHNNFGNTINGNRVVTGYQYGSRMVCGDGFSLNVTYDGLRDTIIGSSFSNNVIIRRIEYGEIGNDVQYNTFNTNTINIGTPAVPLRMTNSVINQKWSNVTLANTSVIIERCVFNGVLNNYIFTESVADKTLPVPTAELPPDLELGGPTKIDFIFPEVELNSVCEESFDFNIDVASSTHTANIASVIYQLRTETGPHSVYETVLETDISAWIASYVTDGTRYWIKCIQVRAVGGIGKGYNTLTLE